MAPYKHNILPSVIAMALEREKNEHKVKTHHLRSVMINPKLTVTTDNDEVH